MLILEDQIFWLPDDLVLKKILSAAQWNMLILSNVFGFKFDSFIDGLLMIVFLFDFGLIFGVDAGCLFFEIVFIFKFNCV